MPESSQERSVLVAPPALPTVNGEYSAGGQEQHNNVLRIFFSRLTHSINRLLGKHGAQYIDAPNGVFYDDTTQSLGSVDTAHIVTFGDTYLNDGVSIVSNSRVSPSVSGVYSLHFSAQLASTNANNKDVSLWLRRSGTDIGYTTHFYTISGAGTKAVATWDFNIDLKSSQYIEFQWASTDTGVTLDATTATSPHPGAPSVAVSISYVSTLPETLPDLP